MKHVFASLVLVSLVVIVTAALLHVLPTLADGELLQNHDFEQGLTGWLTKEADFSLVSSPVHNGSLAAAVTTSQQSDKLFQCVNIVPGESYTLLGYVVKNDPDIERVFLRISWYEETSYEEPNILASHDSSWVTSDSPDYRSLVVNGVAPFKANSAMVQAFVIQRSPGNHVTIYVDDMSFVCTSLGPTPSPTPSPVPTVTPMPTPTPTSTATPIPTPTPTLEPTPFLTSTPTPSLIPTPTPVATPNLTSILTPPLTVSKEGDIVINEVQYDPPQKGVDSEFEWLELLNCTTGTIDLGGWSIGDNSRTDPIPPTLLPPGGFIVIAAREEAFYTNFPEYDGSIVFMTHGRIGNGLSNTGDCLVLKDPTGKVIDALSYGDDSTIMSPPCPDVAEGHSLERQPRGSDSDQAGDFVAASMPTPGIELAIPVPSPAPMASSTPKPALTPAPKHTAVVVPTPAPAATYDQTSTAIPIPTISNSPSPVSLPDRALETQSRAWPWVGTLSIFMGGVVLLAVVFLIKK